MLGTRRPGAGLCLWYLFQVHNCKTVQRIGEAGGRPCICCLRPPFPFLDPWLALRAIAKQHTTASAREVHQRRECAEVDSCQAWQRHAGCLL